MAGEDKSNSARLAGIGGVIAILLAVVGLVADATTLLENSRIRLVIKDAVPYLSILLSVALVGLLFREVRRRESVERELSAYRTSTAGTWRRLVRVLAAGRTLQAVASVDAGRLQPLFDELVKLLPDGFGTHHKFSVARPNPDGTFSLLATRGMDPAAVAVIETQSSWHSGRSFYAALIKDQRRPEYNLFHVEDSAYIDTRFVANNQRRSSSSGAHFLIALRDDDLYLDLPMHTIGIVSVGLPKGLLLSEEEQAELFLRLLPVAKAVEALLLGSSLGVATATNDPEILRPD